MRHLKWGVKMGTSGLSSGGGDPAGKTKAMKDISWNVYGSSLEAMENEGFADSASKA